MKKYKRHLFAHQIEPCRCGHKISYKDILDGKAADLPFTHVSEEKVDDIRYLLQIKPNGSPHNHLTSRRISAITNFYVEKQDKANLHFMRDFQFGDLKDTIFDGGIFSASGLSTDVQSDMVSGEVGYKVWDLIFYKGHDLRGEPLAERLKILKEISHLFPDWMIPSEISYDPKSLLEKVLENNGEGIVIKDFGKIYNPKHWYKVKKEETFDVIITGYTDSNSDKYGSKGWIKSVTMGQYDKTGKMIDCGQTSGMNEEIRSYLSNNRKENIGRVIEIEAQQRLRSGKFRHPRFIRFRDDKNAKECIWQG